MARRGENIHKRKDGRWEARYKKGVDITGKVQYGSVYGKTYSEAKKKLQESYENKKAPELSDNTDRNFGEILTLWLDMNRKNFKGATLKRYTWLIEKHILPELGEIKMSRLNSLILRDFINRKLEHGSLQKTGALSPAYVRNMALIINAALKFATEEQLCVPFKGKIYKPAAEKKELQILTTAEQRKLESKLLTRQNSTTVGILITLWTGLRLGEVCALSWSNVDFDQKILRVRATVARVDSSNGEKKTALILDNPKTKASNRDIPISDFLLKILQEWKLQSVSPFVISDGETFLSPRTFEYRFHRFLHTNELRDTNFHCLRHTFATRCIEVGMDVKTLSEILGHASVSTTLNTYVHPSMDLKRQQINKLTVLAS